MRYLFLMAIALTIVACGARQHTRFFDADPELGVGFTSEMCRDLRLADWSFYENRTSVPDGVREEIMSSYLPAMVDDDECFTYAPMHVRSNGWYNYSVEQILLEAGIDADEFFAELASFDELQSSCRMPRANGTIAELQEFLGESSSMRQLDRRQYHLQQTARLIALYWYHDHNEEQAAIALQLFYASYRTGSPMYQFIAQRRIAHLWASMGCIFQAEEVLSRRPYSQVPTVYETPLF